MVLPIYTYGSEVLRAPTEDILENSDDLQVLIDNMLETMEGAAGIGLAAPQVGRSLRLFVVDLSPLKDDLAEEGEIVPDGPLVFINPEMIDEFGDDVGYEEGCLSIPDIREEVSRPAEIVIRFLDRNFAQQELHVAGMTARVIQHEYDHVEGILFVDHISSFRKQLLKRRLREMAQGNVEADYPLAD